MILLLFGMFVVGEALVSSGYLFTVGDRIFRRTKVPDQVVLAVLFGAGLLSALLKKQHARYHQPPPGPDD